MNGRRLSVLALLVAIAAGVLPGVADPVAAADRVETQSVPTATYSAGSHYITSVYLPAGGTLDAAIDLAWSSDAAASLAWVCDGSIGGVDSWGGSGLQGADWWAYQAGGSITWPVDVSTSDHYPAARVAPDANKWRICRVRLVVTGAGTAEAGGYARIILPSTGPTAPEPTAQPSASPSPTSSPSPTPAGGWCVWRRNGAGHWELVGAAPCTIPSKTFTNSGTGDATQIRWELGVDTGLITTGSGTTESRQKVTAAVSGSTALSADSTQAYPQNCSTTLWSTELAPLYCRALGAQNITYPYTVSGTVASCNSAWASFPHCTAGGGLVPMKEFRLILAPHNTSVDPGGAPAPTPTPTATASPTQPPAPTPVVIVVTPAPGAGGGITPTGPSECVVMPISGECKPGVVPPGTESCSFPWPSLNPLDYFSWIGCLLGQLIGALSGVVAGIVNALIDLLVPGPDPFGPIAAVVAGGLGECVAGGSAVEELACRAPFGWFSQVNGALTSALGGGASAASAPAGVAQASSSSYAVGPTCFTVMGAETCLDLDTVPSSAAQFRPLLEALSWLLFVFVLMRLLLGAVGVASGHVTSKDP